MSYFFSDDNARLISPVFHPLIRFVTQLMRLVLYTRGE